MLRQFILCSGGFFALLLGGGGSVAAQPGAPPAAPRYRNLVMEGGGIRGIAYGGALQALEARGVLAGIERVGGTSAGAIQAALLAVGYSADEIIAVVNATPVQQLNDGRFIFFGGTHRLVKQYGWYRGDAFSAYLDSLVARKTQQPGLTLGELHELAQQQPYRGGPGRFRDLYTTGTNLTTQRTQVFSYETTPDLRVADAVRISMSIPLYFRAVLLDAQHRVVTGPPAPGQPMQVLVDGGLLANYPIDLFDQPRYLPAGAPPPRPTPAAGSSTPKPWACASTAPSRFRSTPPPLAASSWPPTPSPISAPTWGPSTPWPSKTSTPCSPPTGSAPSASISWGSAPKSSVFPAPRSSSSWTAAGGGRRRFSLPTRLKPASTCPCGYC